MRTKNDGQPVLRGHGHAQGGGGRRAEGSVGRGSVRQEEHRPCTQLEHGAGAEPLRLQDRVQGGRPLLSSAPQSRWGWR